MTHSMAIHWVAHPGTYMSIGRPQSIVRERDPWDTAKISVCHWLSTRPGLLKDTRVCQAPAKSSVRNRKCSCVGEYLRPSSSVSLSSASRESRYSFFCREEARGGAELKEREEGRTKKDGQGQWGEVDANEGERRAGPGRGGERG